MRRLTGADGNDRIMVGFDADDPLGPPVSFGLWHVRNGVPTFYDRCTPWMPPTGTRAWLIGYDGREVVLFRYSPGDLVRTTGRLASDPWPAIRRANARLAKLVVTPAVRNAVGDVHIQISPGDRKSALLTLPTGPLSDLSG